jgi:hypothetical protein
MLPPPLVVVERLVAALPVEAPVTTWSSGFRPRSTTVLAPSVLPSCTGTRTGAPLRSTTRKLCCAAVVCP